MSHYYSNPKREHDPYALPDIETWLADIYVVTCERHGEMDVPSYADIPEAACRECGGKAEVSETNRAGWYWWSCSPGCLPDGDPNGPFDTEEQALEDARDGIDDEEDSHE